MGDVETGFAHCREHRLGRRCGSREELDRLAQRLLVLGRRGEDRGHHDRSSAEMGHLVLGERLPDRLGPYPAQAHMRSADHRHGPGKAPAIAMEHRQCPQIDWMLLYRRGDDIALRQQIRTAMVKNHALGIAGGPRRVVERDGVPFILGHRPGKFRIARGEEILVLHVADQCARNVELPFIGVDHDGLRHPRHRQRLCRHARKFAIDDQEPGLGVIEREGDHRRIEPGVEGVEHRT